MGYEMPGSLITEAEAEVVASNEKRALASPLFDGVEWLSRFINTTSI